MILHHPQSPKAIDRAVSAYLAKCAQIADPEVAGFGQLSPTRLLEAQQDKIPHEKSKGLRAGSNPSKRGLIIQGSLCRRTGAVFCSAPKMQRGAL
jgi:hypothetical protein